MSRGFRKFAAEFGATTGWPACTSRAPWRSWPSAECSICRLRPPDSGPSTIRSSIPAPPSMLFRNSRARQRVFTSDLWGGYMIYRLYPRTKVFVDGRSDMYGEAFAKK